MPENQNPYLDPNMNPGAVPNPYAAGYPAGMPPEYAEAGMPYGVGAQPDAQGAWGAPYGQADQQPYVPQGYGAAAGAPYADEFSNAGTVPPQDAFAPQGYGQPSGIGAEPPYYGGAQYGAYGDPAAAYADPLYQAGAAPYQADSFAQQPQGQGAYYGQQDAPSSAQPSAGTTQTDYAAWQFGQDVASPMPQQPYQPQAAYGQQPQAQPDMQSAYAPTSQFPQADPTQPAYQQPAAQQPYEEYPSSGEYAPYDDPSVIVTPIDPTYPTSGRAIRCLIFGILSIVLALIPPIGLILAIVTMHLSKKYLMNGGTDGKAEAGRIFGIAGLVFSIMMLAFVVGFVCFMVGALTGTSGARDLIVYFNASPLGSLITIPL